MELNILILTLMTGEELIANVKDHTEKVDGVEQKVCYSITYPFRLQTSGPIEGKTAQLTLVPWKFWSCDTSFLLGYDKILNMCTPLKDVTEQYTLAVDNFIKTLAETQQ